MKLTKRSELWLNKLQATGLKRDSVRFLKGQTVEIGYRSTCGTTDQTQKDFRIFQGFLKALKAQGINYTESPVKHKNAWATNNGGFWNSFTYQIAA